MTTPSKKPLTTAELEATLRQYKHPSRLHLESGFDLIVLINALGIVTYVSSSITSLLGYTPEAIVGCPASTLIHPDDLATLQQVSVARGKTPGRSLSADYRLLSQDGSWSLFEGRGTNLLQEPGIEGLLGTFRQSTPRKLAPRPHWSQMHAAEHFVQFYETDAFLLDSVSGYLSAGLGAGDACIVVATPAHRAGLEERLKTHGWEQAAIQRRNQYLSLDAGETLARWMSDGVPEPGRFAEVMGSVIRQVAKDRRPVRIFGEMVQLLWAEGNHTGAIRLEECWNDLHHTVTPFSLFCAYSIKGFAGQKYRLPFTQICQQHAQVIPAESYTALASPEERLRAITLLQQEAHSLQAEIVERKAPSE